MTKVKCDLTVCSTNENGICTKDVLELKRKTMSLDAICQDLSLDMEED